MKGRGGGKKPFGRKGFSPKGNSGKSSGKPFGKGREKSFESRASVSSHDVFDLGEEEQENLNELKKFADVETYDYELPEDFEDEEIDEEGAFPEDEDMPISMSEEQFTKKRGKGKKVVEEDDEDDDEYQDLTEFWDENENEEKNKSRPQQEISKNDKKSAKFEEDEVEENEDDEIFEDFKEDDDENEQENEEEIDSEDEEAVDKHNKLIDTVTRMSKKKRKMEEIAPPSANESVFAATSSGSLSITDLMSSLKDTTGYSDLKKKLDVLEDRKSKPGVGTLPAPLSNASTERLTRKAGYEETKRELRKWKGFIHTMQDKEHVSFPLQPERVDNDKKTLAETFTPENDMEKEIQMVLRQSGLSKEKELEKDDLGYGEVTEEEVRKRRAELIKMRNLMYYQEQKARWKNKIKSKKYRRIMKKEKERGKMSIEELREINPELARQEEEKLALDRIRERASLRHSKNKTAFSRNAYMTDSVQRQAVEEQLALKDQLRKKIQSIDGENDDYDIDESTFETSSFAVPEPEDMPKKGLFAMKFMQNKVMADIEEVKKEEGNKEITHSDILLSSNKKRKNQSNDEDVPVVTGNKVKMSGPLTIGAAPLGDRPITSKLFDELAFPDEPESTLNSTPIEEQDTINGNHGNESTTVKVTSKGKKENNDIVIHDDSKVLVNTKEFSKKNPKVTFRTEIMEEEDDLPTQSNSKIAKAFASVPDTENPWLNVQETAVKRSKMTPKQVVIEMKKEEKVQIDFSKTINSVNSETTKKSASKFNLLANANDQQKELIDRAFGTGEQYEEDFAAEKEKLVSDGLPKDESSELPGWGDWSGAGIVAPPKKKKKKEEEDKNRPKRKDDGLDHVIINEKSAAPHPKYTIKSIPREFTTLEQYEKALTMPLGKDWNTSRVFKERTRPAIEVKRGAIIEPIDIETAQKEVSDLRKAKQQEKNKEKKKKFKQKPKRPNTMKPLTL